MLLVARPRLHKGSLNLWDQLSSNSVFAALVEYNDSEPAIIAQHLKWSREANIHLLSHMLIANSENHTKLNTILPHKNLSSQ